jgi:hypothetical protein
MLPGRPVRQPFLTYRIARMHRLGESILLNRFLGSLNVYKFGLGIGTEEGVICMIPMKNGSAALFLLNKVIIFLTWKENNNYFHFGFDSLVWTPGSDEIGLASKFNALLTLHIL